MLQNSKIFANFIQKLVRPQRYEYKEKDLGYTHFKYRGTVIKRGDDIVINKRGEKLKISYWYQASKKLYGKNCLIFLHGSSSSRVEALEALILLIKDDYLIVAFDFAGCGQSEGEYISLGYNEAQDLEQVVQFLRFKLMIKKIGLWGRSMGAVTAIMFAKENPYLSVMILDSAYTNIDAIAEEKKETNFKLVPTFIFNWIYGNAKEFIKNKYKFDLNDVNPLQSIKDCMIPAMFISGKKDTLISTKQTQKLFDAHPGTKNEKQIFLLEKASHNSGRSNYILNKIRKFISEKMCRAHRIKRTKITKPRMKIKKLKLNVEICKIPEVMCQEDNTKLFSEDLFFKSGFDDLFSEAEDEVPTSEIEEGKRQMVNRTNNYHEVNMEAFRKRIDMKTWPKIVQ